MKKILFIVSLFTFSLYGDYLKFGVSASHNEAPLTANMILEKIKESNPKTYVGMFKNPTLFTQNSTLVALKMGWIDLALFDEKGLDKIIGGKKGSLTQALEQLGFKGCGPYKDGSYLVVSKKRWNNFTLTTQNSLQTFVPVSIQQVLPATPTIEPKDTIITPLPSVPVKPNDIPQPSEQKEKKPYNPRLLQES
jgi:hypothetical protein